MIAAISVVAAEWGWCVPTRLFLGRRESLVWEACREARFTHHMGVLLTTFRLPNAHFQVVEEETKGDALAAGFPTTENHAYQQHPRTVSVLQIGIVTHLHLQVFFK